MKLAFIIFDDVTWMDLVGVYDPIFRLKHMGYINDLEWDFCSLQNAASDQYGFAMKSTRQGGSLSNYDAIIVPGGYGTRKLAKDQPFLEWLRTAGNVKYKISVCTGSLLLGAAGFLKGKKATTHFGEYETLKPFCSEVVYDRIVEDGDVITAGAVTSSIDLGLYLCEKWAGPEAAATIRSRMDYRC